MNILITGAVGFIGFNLCESLLKKKHKIYGIDNFDNYYSIKIKKKRLEILNKRKNFYFKKIDITQKSRLFNFFKKKKIDIIIHLAAQAGVRYSLINTKKYVDVNILGFFNIIELARETNIKKFIYASSSSVYGDSKKFPLSENQKLNPKNIYGLTKKMNEQIAAMYSKFFGLKCIGLRFFTIYGEWGRPDMFLLKLFNASLQNKKFYLNNYGNHKRDFTYIDDAIKIVLKLINYKIVNNEIFNICSNKPIKILDIIKYFKEKNNVEVKLIEMHKADVIDTHGDNTKIKRVLKRIKFSGFYKCFETTYEWYKQNNINKI